MTNIYRKIFRAVFVVICLTGRMMAASDSAASTVADPGSNVLTPSAPKSESATNMLADPSAIAPPPGIKGAKGREERWNWHIQNTDIVQADPAFNAKYSGPNSLRNDGEAKETVSLDLMLGLRLWQGAEVYLDTLVWQGWGLSQTLGIEAFPNAEAYRFGTTAPNIAPARFYIKQTINLGGEEETVEDDALQLAGKRDISRVTLWLGEMSVLDIFDNNTYAHDPRTQFMNWALVGNEAWDYPANSIGYETGFAAELNRRDWALRYGFFQVPKYSNGMGQDEDYLKAWGMVTELERRWAIQGHPGAIRFLAYLNSAHMGSYEDAVDSSIRPANVVLTRSYRYKYGFCLNFEQEITTNIGVFSRLGWSDGHTEAWAYSDVDQQASLGVSLKGALWSRPTDTFGLAGIFSGLSKIHQEFFEDGGTGILGGDGALSYGVEKTLETYYDFPIWKSLRAAFDYQFVSDPAFNRDRGPVSVYGIRVHCEF